MARKRKQREFTEKNVLREMAKELEVKPGDLVIEESPLTSFGEGDAFTVSFAGGGPYGKEWTVVADDDAAENIALAVVAQDLEQQPEIFSRDFIESHINMKALERWVYEAQMEDDYAYEIARSEPDRFWEEAERWGIDVPEPDEDGDMPDEVDDEYIEELKEAIATDRAKDPMAFFEDIYGRDEATKYAIDAVGIDIEGAAEEAVNIDGWQHFLCHYDGTSDETDSGFVYWRDN